MSLPEILHVAQDEKFILAARYLFEKAFPGQNRFVIIKPAGDPPLRYLKDDFKADYLVHNPDTVSRLLEFEEKAGLVVFHGMDKIKGQMYVNSQNKWKFVAIIFGAEVYNDRVSGDDFLGAKTARMVTELQRKSTLDWLKTVYRWVRYRDTNNLYDHLDMKQVIREMSTFGFLSEHTYCRLIKKGILNPSSRMVPFSYYPLDFIIKRNDLKADGPNILLGNSASATNNHLEAIDLLKAADLKEGKVIIPLSYGKPKYADAVEKYAHQQLGDRVQVLREFMPLEQYNELISSCGYVLMNHNRSQAMGNLITSLYIGARVFVNDTDAYTYFKNLGCHIFLVDEYLGSKPVTLNPLPDRHRQENRQILLNNLSTETLVDNLRQSVRTYFNI